MGARNAPSISTVLLFALLNTLSTFAAEKSICSLSHFGLPDYQACNSLLFSSTTGRHRGINVIDGADHAFLLQGFAEASDFTEEQWKYKVYIPHLFSNQGCKILLAVQADPKGGLTHDTSHWPYIANDGRLIVEDCLSPLPTGRACSGGQGKSGTKRKLVMYLYSWGSTFDRNITPQSAVGNTIVTSSGGAVGNVSVTAPLLSPFQISLDKTNTPTNVTASTYGQECSSNGDCKAEGCVCVAGSIGESESKLWAGTCKLLYAEVSNGQKLNTAELSSTVSSNSSNTIELLDMIGPTACSCNCTYVSKSCCGSASGFVLESSALKLGTLQAPSGQYCNLATGRFQTVSASSDLDATS